MSPTDRALIGLSWVMSLEPIENLSKRSKKRIGDRVGWQLAHHDHLRVVDATLRPVLAEELDHALANMAPITTTVMTKAMQRRRSY